MLTGDEASCAEFAKIGADFHLDEQLEKDIEALVCKLYKGKEETCVNLLRYHMFKQGKCSDARLPPNQDCLLKHAQRANYQAAIWKRSTIPVIGAPTPANHGWKFDAKGDIAIVWMDGNCAPDVLQKNCNCKCKTGCSSNRCSCKKASNYCSDMCQCTECTNMQDELIETDDDFELSSDDEI